MTCARVIVVLALLLLSAPGVAGPLSVDAPVRAGGLWCLPDSASPLSFRYLPSDARLARREDGTPLFSLVYFTEAAGDGSLNARRGEADGGALLNFMVEYHTPPARAQRADAALKQLIDPDAELLGPVVFSAGTYSLVSATTEAAETRFADGSAPALPNGRVAVSVRLDQREARILEAALQSSTPDLSLVFDLVYAGVTASYDADIVIDWEKASHSLDRGINAGVSVYGIGVGGEIEEAVTDMMSDGAISIEVRGEDESMDAIVTQVQQMATELFFTPLENVEAEADFGQFAMPPAPSGANRYFSVNAQVKYKRKDIATTGRTVISLNRDAPATRRWSIVFDAGEIAADLVNDPNHVRVEDITDRRISSREIAVLPDSGLVGHFSAMTRSVTVELRKMHSDGRETYRQVFLAQDQLATDAEVRLSYPRFSDEPWDEWLEYRYRALWSLRDYPAYQTGWLTSRDPAIHIVAPFRQATVYPVGNLQAMRDRGIAMVVVEVSYPFSGSDHVHREIVSTASDTFPPFSLVVPADHENFKYTVTHVYEGRGRSSYTLSDRAGFVPIDRVTLPDDSDSPHPEHQ